jgi:type I restriction enzyme S subunit
MSFNPLFPHTPSKWEWTTLGELAKESGGDIQTGPFGSQLHARDYVDDGIPSIMPKNISIDTVLTEDIARVSADDINRLAKYKVQTGDIVYSRRGDVEKCSRITEREDGWLCGTGCLRVRVLPGKVSTEYLHAYLCHPSVREWIVRHAVGATMPNLNTSILSALPVIVPTQTEMEKVASIWLSLSGKIQINNQINQTLEKIAQAIFKSWFVDFEPVKAKIAALEAGGSEEYALLAAMQTISAKSADELARLQTEHPDHYANLRATADLFPSAMLESELGEIPEGWEVGPLSKIIQFNPRRSLKKGVSAPYLDMKNVPTSGHLAEDVVYREMKSGTKFINGDTLLARITPCLENGKTAYVDFLEHEQVGWGSTEYIVMRSQEPYPEAISYFIARDQGFRQHAIQSMTGTSGRQRANAKALAELSWVIYPGVIVEAFNQMAAPYLDLARSHGNESMSLSALRDTLLPKLLSGELSLHESKVQLESLKEVAHV